MLSPASLEAVETAASVLAASIVEAFSPLTVTGPPARTDPC